MSADNPEILDPKAQAFFGRANQVADTNNFDYAIEMFVEGLRLAPDELQKGHIPLRRISLIREGKGGKKPSFKEKMKLSSGKTPLDKMLNAETLLAKDPDNLSYAESLLSAAVAAGYAKTAEWIANLIFEANKSNEKPSLATYIHLKDSYAKLQLYPRAVLACQCALQLRPGDDELQQDLRNLSANMTLQRGKYEEEGNFTKSIKNREKQEQIYSEQRLIKTADSKSKALEKVKKAVLENPKSIDNVMKLAQTLFDQNTRKGCEQAVKVLRDAYARSKNFVFKKKEGDFIIKRLSLESRQAKAALSKDPDNKQLQNTYNITLKKLDKARILHYKLCVENNPLDLATKFEYAQCLAKAEKYDEAIPLFQDASRDPRKKLSAMNETGHCFFQKKWYTDAIDVFSQALEACEIKDSQTGKEIRYNLARSYEEEGQAEKALEIYRKLAQSDFGFKDVQQRVDNLRKAIQ